MGVFTRDNEELLSYDADAFFYFAGAMLTVLLLPWSYVAARWLLAPRPPEHADFDARGPATKGSVVRRCGTADMEAKRNASLEAARKWKSRLSGSVGVQLVAIAFLWTCLGAVCLRLKDTPPELRKFDPYAILGLEQGADIKDIKKAYRQKSLQHHPDKDRDNPLAPVMFQQVTKAYAALTDEGARRNYAKYGNPDGPSQTKVGIALHPAMLVGKGRQLTTLILFFSILFIVPLSIVCCCLRGSNLSAGGVTAETLRIFNACIDIEVSGVDGPGLLAASIEARRQATADIHGLIKAMTALKPMPLQPGVMVEIRSEKELRGRRGVLAKCGEARCEVEVWPKDGPPKGPEDLQTHVLPRSILVPIEPRIPCPFSDPPIRRGAALLWGHLWRFHEHMSPDVKAELDSVLWQSVRLGRAMCSIAAHGHGDRSAFFDVVRSIVHFRRCLVQAMDLEDSPLLQLPHVSRVPDKAPSFSEVVNGAEATLAEKLKLTPEQRLDVQSFCRHVPRVKIACQVEVSDEAQIAEGDMATLTVHLLRQNLAENEAAGPVHAPFFPGPKFEEWWLLVYDNRARRLITTEVILGTGRQESAKIHFMVPRHGSFRWTVHAMCDSYAGLDVEHVVEFKAARRSEVDRDIFIHPEDMKIKTLFEELMEGLQPDEQESESEDESEKKPPPAPEAPAPEAGTSDDAAPAAGAAEPQRDAPGAGEGSSDEDAVPFTAEMEGGFWRVANPRGAHIYREPREDPQLRMGTIPGGQPIRGFDDDRPDGWIELAWGGNTSAWIRVGPSELGGQDGEASAHPPGVPEAVPLGGLAQQQLRLVVQTHATMPLIRRWMRNASAAIAAEDIIQVREIEDPRARLLVEEMARKRVGDEVFDKLLDEVEAIVEKRRRRISKALGLFASANGIIWHVTHAGAVRGLHMDGSRIRDRVEVTKDDHIQIGPFRLDESRTCSCIHWIRRDDPSKAWVWSPDRTLRTRVRLGTPEGS